MGWKNMRDFEAYAKRKSARYAGYGRVLELYIESLLSQLLAAGRIHGFTRHAAHSKEDEDGKDFTVLLGQTERSFGVTISLKAWRRGKFKHPLVPQLCFPIGTNQSTIERRVLELFNTAPP